MSEKASGDERRTESATTDSLAQQVASSTYKILGAFTDSTGAGVLGKNTAGSGTPIGVEGAVPNSDDGFGLSTPDDARVGGTLETDAITDNGSGSVSLGNTLDLGGNALTDTTGTLTIEGSTDNGVRITTDGSSRIIDLGVPETDGFDTAGGNVVAGHPNNAVNGGAVGSVVGGGGNSGTDNENTVEDHYGVVGGGEANQAGSTGGSDATHATVAGGGENTASGSYGTVGGGQSNTASGQYATVAGGDDNTADGNDVAIGGGYQNTASEFAATIGGGYQNTVTGSNATVAGGQSNDVDGVGAFVGGGFSNAAGGYSATVPGGDGNTADGDYSLAAGRSADTNGNHGAFVWGDSSTTAVTASAGDQVVFQAGGSRTTGTAVEMYSQSDGSAGVELAVNDGTWASLSSRAAKTDVDPVSGPDVLQTVDSLDISTWRYDGQNESVRHMGPMAEDFHDAFGLGTSAETIAALDTGGVALAAIQGLSTKLDEREGRVEELETEVDALRTENEQLRERNAELEDRLARIETELGLDSDGGRTATADD